MMSNRLIKAVTNLGEVPANEIGMTKLFFNLELLTRASNSKNITKNLYLAGRRNERVKQTVT